MPIVSSHWVVTRSCGDNAKRPHRGAQVVILDKEHFPRDKYCGDAVCTPALRILEDMGVMEVLSKNNECHYANAGGFVAPSGLSYIGERSACTAPRNSLPTALLAPPPDPAAHLRAIP